MNSPGIENLSHLALHFLVSQKHGRKRIRERIEVLKITNIKPSLHKGIKGVSQTPIQYPSSAYKKRVGEKPTICPVCSFQTKTTQQMELHHPGDDDFGPKAQRTKAYYRTEVTPMCSNCHSLEHRSGEKLKESCGLWHRVGIPKNLKYADPGKIFNSNCNETYQLQKVYFCRWHLRNSEQYKCEECGVSHWGSKQRLLSLELHHIDQSHSNSTIENLQLLCPN